MFWRHLMKGTMAYDAQYTMALYTVRLRIRNVTAYAHKPCSLSATGVSLNGMHIYGDTGRNTRSRLRGQQIVSRGREKED